jgi:hypothetical protein
MDRLQPKEFVSDIAAARNYNLNQNNSHAEITKHFRSARCNQKLALDTLLVNHTKIGASQFRSIYCTKLSICLLAIF